VLKQNRCSSTLPLWPLGGSLWPGLPVTENRGSIWAKKGKHGTKELGEIGRIAWWCEKYFLDYPVVRRELRRSYGYSYSLLNGELRSYHELPNHILVDNFQVYLG